MSYENKTIEELIELLEERDGDINDKTERLEQLQAEYKDLESSASNLESEISDLRNEDQSMIERAFYYGLDSASILTMSPLKSWLTFKMENRL